MENNAALNERIPVLECHPNKASEHELALRSLRNDLSHSVWQVSGDNSNNHFLRNERTQFGGALTAPLLLKREIGMDIRKYFLLFFLACQAFIFAVPVSAQTGGGSGALLFDIGEPATIKALPRGQLKRAVRLLPSEAENQALSWLRRFSFPPEDLGTLHVDNEGNVFYADTHLPDSNQKSELPAETAPVATRNDAFLLHSRPGAANTVYIDFDGHIIAGTAWNSSVYSYDALPYDLDGDTSTFNATERSRIADIWHKVSEDLAPFDIDVTTEEPANFDHLTGHILVTHTVDGAGESMPGSGGSGAAYVDVFGDFRYHTYYSPALVYYDQLADGDENHIAETSSHEFGHNLGLSHDGTISGDTYYQGHDTGLVSWAPIMGDSYHSNVSQWSNGNYAGANQPQDDLALIRGKLGSVVDDHGDTLLSYSRLKVAADGSVVSSNPELDPHNILPENKGIIDSSNDVDVFSFVTGSGNLSLSVTPAWDAFYRSTSNYSANLYIRAELQNVGGLVVASSDSTGDTHAIINAEVSAGTYKLVVNGVGEEPDPVTGYSSQGQFFVNGTVPPSAPEWIEFENNPVIKYSDTLNGILWNDPSVIKEGSGYRMWLTGGYPFAAEIVVKAYEAYSEDGIDWDINPKPVLEPGPAGSWDDLRTETPTVIKVGDTYHMYYSGCPSPCITYEIGHATSTDGTHWVKDPQNPVVTHQPHPLKWGFYVAAEPSIVHHEGTFYLYYAGAKSNWPKAGSQFGVLLATSTDGSDFDLNGAVYTMTPSYDPDLFRGYSTPMVFVDDGTFHLYHDVVYSPDSPHGFDQIAISHATSDDGLSFVEAGENIIGLEEGWKQLTINGPTVLQDGDTTKMWFAAYTNYPGFGFGIGYASKQAQ